MNVCDKILKGNHDSSYTVLERAIIRFILFGKKSELNEIFGKMVQLKCVKFQLNKVILYLIDVSLRNPIQAMQQLENFSIKLNQ